MRNHEEHVSLLKPFEASVSKDFPEFLIVYCPHEDCVGTMNDRPFLVHKRTWIRPIKRISLLSKQTTITGRPCPYCQRVSRVPRGVDRTTA